jgi:hypothetical protein
LHHPCTFLGTRNGIAAKPAVKELISASALQLEKLNPTKAPTKSELLTGTWNLVYTSNAGSSAGKIGPFVGQVIQEIGNQEYVNIVKLAPFFEAALTATWKVKSSSLWLVLFQTLEVKLLGIPVVKKPLEAEGIWRTTYLDDDFRILYAQGGKNTLVENIYILEKTQ